MSAKSSRKIALHFIKQPFWHVVKASEFLVKKKKKIQNLDIVKRLEEECGHINVGIVSIVHQHTDVHTHTHTYRTYTVKKHMYTHISPIS